MTLITQFLYRRQPFDNLVVRFFGVLLRIELEDPVLPGKLNDLRILLDLVPVCLMPHVSGRLPSLLCRSDAFIPDLLVGSHRYRHALLPTFAETNSNTNYIFQINTRELLGGVILDSSEFTYRHLPVPVSLPAHW